jgi:hypothetical protein
MPLALALVPKYFAIAPASAAFVALQHSVENCWDPLRRSPIARREKTDTDNQNFTTSFRKSQSNATQRKATQERCAHTAGNSFGFTFEESRFSIIVI